MSFWGEIEWVVDKDADPSNVVVYRGPDGRKAREVFDDIVAQSGWGAVLYYREVGPKITVAKK